MKIFLFQKRKKFKFAVSNQVKGFYFSDELEKKTKNIYIFFKKHFHQNVSFLIGTE